MDTRSWQIIVGQAPAFLSPDLREGFGEKVNDSSAPEQKMSTAEINRSSILIIDDDAQIRSLLCSILDEEYDCVTVNSAEDPSSGTLLFQGNPGCRQSGSAASQTHATTKQ